MAFCIAIDSRSKILKQCNGWPSKPPFHFLQKWMREGVSLHFVVSLYFSTMTLQNVKKPLRVSMLKHVVPTKRAIHPL